jgi:Heparinase II/III-like protein/Domain of unknown function (DUF4962)
LHHNVLLGAPILFMPTMRISTVAALLAASLLVACGGSDPVVALAETRDAKALALQPVALPSTSGTAETISPAPVTANADAGDVAPPPPPTAGTILTGAGLPGRLQSGCTPTLRNDFIDNDLFYLRRLRPLDCARLQTNLPFFSWTNVSSRNKNYPWTLTVRNATTQAVVASRNVQVPRAWLTSPLPAGNYEWAVSYRSAYFASVTGEWRRFNVGANAVAWSPPTGAALAQTVAAKGHPRTLPAGANFTNIGNLARGGDYATGFQTTMVWARWWRDNRAIPKPPDELTPRPSVGTMLSQAITERVTIETLAYGWRFSGDTTLRDAAVARLLTLSRWLPTGASSDAIDDQVNREVMLTLSIGFDLLEPQLNAAQRVVLADNIRQRLQAVFAKFPNFDAYPHQSHLSTGVLFSLETLLNVTGMPEFPQSQAMLATAWEYFQDFFNTWGNEDGGFANGVGYAWHEFGDLVRSVAMLRLAAGVDMTAHPFIANYGDYLMHVTAPGSERLSAFGDDLNITSFYKNQAANHFRMYAALTRKPAHAWYWRSVPANLAPGYLNPLIYMVLGIYPKEVAAVAPSTHSLASADAGVAALHSSVSDSLRSTVYFRSGPTGAFNHSHADNNAFTFDSRGKNVLISAGYYPWYRSPHHATVQRATRYKNALTFDGGIGQGEKVATLDFSLQPMAPGIPSMEMDIQGELINHHDNGTWAVVSGDATRAYRMENLRQKFGPVLTTALRTVAMNRAERVTLVYDYATSATPRQWELNFQALNAFVPEGGGLYRALNQGASVCVSVHGLVGSSFSQVTGFAVAPEHNLPNQWHGRFTAAIRTPQLASVTVIREDCRAVPVNVTVQGSVVTVSVNGRASIVFDQRKVTVPN